MSKADQNPDQQQPEQKAQGSIPQMPRTVKYAWGVVVTILLGLSLVLDRGNPWLPLLNRAIDLMQEQTAPTGNR